MNIFDCHLHVDNGLDEYDLPLDRGNVIFNHVDSFRKWSSSYPSFSQSLIFDFRNNLDFVTDTIKAGQIRALKIHSRVQQIGDADYEIISQELQRINESIPIIYDAFYYGHDFKHQPNLPRLAWLAEKFPNNKFIVAHAGGHRVLDYFFHLRELKNIGFDLSFSLQYLLNTSAFADLEKLIRHTDRRRLFWGSDFPYAKPDGQLNTLLAMLSRLKFHDKEIEDVCELNWMEFTDRV